jgi:hypothetical protein
MVWGRFDGSSRWTSSPRDAGQNEYGPVPPAASAKSWRVAEENQPGPKRSRELLMLVKRCNNVKRTKKPERISAGSNFRDDSIKQ